MTSHLSALQVHLSNERNYLAKAKSEGERALRKVWIAQIEKEIDVEEAKFLEPTSLDFEWMSDEELLRELTA